MTTDLKAPSIDDLVLVVGSVNVDRALYVERFPRPGETLTCTSAPRVLGGKGANQAIAARRMGARVAFIGLVGDDRDGDFARAQLALDEVETEGVSRVGEGRTGSATITVDAEGENMILVDPGVNHLFGATEIEAIGRVIGGQRTLIVCQGELGAPAVDAVAAWCGRRDIEFVLNLAPFVPVDRSALARADLLIVNEIEAVDLAAFLGLDVVADGLEALAVALLAHTRGVIITLGAEGAILALPGRDPHRIAPWPVEHVVDSSGAGDCFVGALLAERARGSSWRNAAEAGAIAASLAVQHPGTSSSFPRRNDVEVIRAEAAQAEAIR